MNKKEFSVFARDRILIMDGATGSQLIARGMPHNACAEEWVSDHPEVIMDLQRKYIDAGSDIIIASTFGANRARLTAAGMYDSIGRLNSLPVSYARQVADENGAFVAGDISITGESLEPYGDMEAEEALDIYREQASLLTEAGCDMLMLETFMDLSEAELALKAAAEVSDLPLLVTMTFEKSGRTMYGSAPEEAAARLTELGASAVGANCSMGPVQMLPIIEKMAAVTDLPLIAKPNAGLPHPGPNGVSIYDLDADNFAIQMTALVDAGATLVGGCCGTGPEYIRNLTMLVSNMASPRNK